MERRAERYERHYEGIIRPDWSEQFKHSLEENRDYDITDDGEIILPGGYFINGFTHPKLTLLTSGGNVGLYNWGLIPSWVKDKEKAKDLRTKTLNAVGETVWEKPSFRSAIKARRGLLLIDGFFEWREVNKKKYPYFIRMKDGKSFSLGTIHEEWVDKSTGEIIKTFSIITTPANPLMEKIHNLKRRMPLIISKEKEAEWIDGKLGVERVKELIQPLDENLMAAHTISTDANSAKKNRNVKEILDEVEYPDLIDN